MEVFDARLGWWILGYNRRRLRALGGKGATGCDAVLPPPAGPSAVLEVIAIVVSSVKPECIG